MRFLILMFLGWLSLGSVRASAEEILVSLKNIRPTQMEVGLAHVEYSRQKIEKIAKNSNLPEAAASRVLPAWIGPDGKIYITDGHHWASGTQRVSDTHPELADQIKLKVNIEADYRGKSWESFFQALHQNGKGYFTPAVRAQYEGQGTSHIKEMYQTYLPKNLQGLKNNAGRSLFGMALEEIGIDPNFDLVDYIEFYLAEKFNADIEKTGIKISTLVTPDSITPELIKKVQRELVTQPEMLDYILNHTRPGVDPATARAHLLHAMSEYRKSLGLEPLAIPAARLTEAECSVKFQKSQSTH